MDSESVAHFAIRRRSGSRVVDQDDAPYGFLKEVYNEAEDIKRVFQHWDADSSGQISKDELKDVMKLICPMTDSEIDALMQEADTNGNGLIEYTEFVDWLTKPATESRAVALLDYAALLRPLFELYDRDGNGTINFLDFEECHGILQTALLLHPAAEGQQDEGVASASTADGMDLTRSASEAFKLADRDKDNKINFTDFVEWMRDHLDIEGVTNAEIWECTSKLVKMLTGVFRLVKVHVDPHSKLHEDDAKVLERLVENLAKTVREFDTLLLENGPGELNREESSDLGCKSTWAEPNVGMNIDRLKAFHCKLYGTGVRNVEKIDFEVLSAPMPGDDPTKDRLWVAEVLRVFTYTSGRKYIEKPAYYIFSREEFRWLSLESSLQFDQSLAALPPELHIFCILKTAANFGIRLKWDDIVIALREAITRDALKPDELERFVAHMELQVKSQLAEEGMSPSSRRINEARTILSNLIMRPREVMAVLTELQIVKINPVWKDFILSD